MQQKAQTAAWTFARHTKARVLIILPQSVASFAFFGVAGFASSPSSFSNLPGIPQPRLRAADDHHTTAVCRPAGMLPVTAAKGLSHTLQRHHLRPEFAKLSSFESQPFLGSSLAGPGHCKSACFLSVTKSPAVAILTMCPRSIRTLLAQPRRPFRKHFSQASLRPGGNSFTGIALPFLPLSGTSQLTFVESCQNRQQLEGKGTSGPTPASRHFACTHLV